MGIHEELLEEQRAHRRDRYVVEAAGGMKDDADKPRYELLPWGPIEDLVKILTFGAKKYEPNNWMKVDPERYVGALYRHLSAWRQGESLDSDSGQHHLAHALCNVVFLLWLEKHSGQG